MLEKGHKFHTLDGLRGVAALAVMQFHTAGLFGGRAFPQGYLAVDFFFILSGFVLTFAYQRKLDEGWSTSSFLLTRAIRLYPLYFLGLLLGFALKGVQMRYGSVHPSLGTFLGFAVLGLFMLPAPPWLVGYGPSTFPLNAPTWSLFYEVIANVVHALLFRRRGWVVLASVMGLAGVGMIVSAHWLGTMDFGWKRTEMVYGMLRVLYSYIFGMLLFRLWRTGRFKVQIHPAVVALVLLALLAVPIPMAWVSAYGLVVTLVVFPLLVFVSASSRTPERLVSTAAVLGTLSYALYVLHDPIAETFARVWVHFRGHEAEFDAPWSGIVYAAITIGTALLVDVIYDLPVRKFLRSKLQGGRGLSGAAR